MAHMECRLGALRKAALLILLIVTPILVYMSSTKNPVVAKDVDEIVSVMAIASAIPTLGIVSSCVNEKDPDIFCRKLVFSIDVEIMFLAGVSAMAIVIMAFAGDGAMW